MKSDHIVMLFIATIYTFGVTAGFADGQNVEDEPAGNPLATFEDMERLLKEEGDKLSAQEKYQIRVWIEHFKTPINFWAIVVDTDGKPIPGAQVHVELQDDPNMDWEAERNNSEYVLTADHEGKVFLLNKRGAGLRAVASAEGYAPAYKSIRSLAEAQYISGNDEDPHAIPWSTEAAAKELVLRKKGPIPKIKYQAARYLRPSSDGKPLKVDIHGGKYLVEVRLWSSRPDDALFDDAWDWRAELRPVKGQIRKREKGHHHAAPTDGYEDKFTIIKNKEDEKWSRSVIGWQAEYWIRWEDGTYAMVDLGVETSRKNRVEVESWINLDRNNSFEDFKQQEMEQRKKR